MQIVIDIPKELYESYECRPPMVGDVGMDMIAQSIANGTPLPEGHGDLIDRQVLIDNGFKKGFCNWYDEIKYADPVIKAEESESK